MPVSDPVQPGESEDQAERSGLTYDEADLEMTDLFEPARRIHGSIAETTGAPPREYEFQSRLTKKFADRINAELIAKGQRPAFIRWESVSLKPPPDAEADLAPTSGADEPGPPRSGVSGVRFLGILVLLFLRR